MTISSVAAPKSKENTHNTPRHNGIKDGREKSAPILDNMEGKADPPGRETDSRAMVISLCYGIT